MKKISLLFLLLISSSVGYSQVFDSTDYQIIHLQDTVISGNTLLYFQMTTKNNTSNSGYADFTFVDQNGNAITSPTHWSMWMPKANSTAFDTTSYFLNYKVGIDSFPSNFNGFLKVMNPNCTIFFNNWPLSTTSVNNTEESFLFYPNPVSDKLLIINKTAQKIDLIEFYNQEGKLVKQLLPISNSLDVSDLAKGIYLLRIYSNTLIETVKMVKD